MRPSSFLFLLSTFFWTENLAHAQDPTPIESGEPAPFSGTLLSNEDAADLLAQIKTCSERSTLDLQEELERSQLKCEFEKSILEINLENQKAQYESVLESQDRQLDYILKSKNPRLSREATFIIGIVAGVAITSASAYSISVVSSRD